MRPVWLPNQPKAPSGPLRIRAGLLNCTQLASHKTPTHFMFTAPTGAQTYTTCLVPLLYVTYLLSCSRVDCRKRFPTHRVDKLIIDEELQGGPGERKQSLTLSVHNLKTIHKIFSTFLKDIRHIWVAFLRLLWFWTVETQLPSHNPGANFMRLLSIKYCLANFYA